MKGRNGWRSAAIRAEYRGRGSDPQRRGSQRRAWGLGRDGRGKGSGLAQPSMKERAAAEIFRSEAPNGEQQTDVLAAVLRPQKHQAEAADRDEEAELKVLPAVEESVPDPKVLGDWHGDQFDGGQEEQHAAETNGEARGIRGLDEVRTSRDGAAQQDTSHLSRFYAGACETRGSRRKSRGGGLLR